MRKISIKGSIDANFYDVDKNIVKGVVVVCHGFGEHSGSYKELAEHLEKENYACIIFNQRGHGDLPPKKRGVIPSYQAFMDDIKSVVDYAKNEVPNIPIALYGHSMGGNIALNYLLKHGQSEFKCAILEAPWLALHEIELSPFEIKMSKAISRLAPNFTIPKRISKLPIPVNELTSDTKVHVEFASAPYHNRMTWRLAAEVHDACEHALTHSQQISIPVFLIKAKHDKVVCNKAIDKLHIELCKTYSDNKNNLYEHEAKHTIHKDDGKEIYFSKLTDFLNKHMQ